MRGGAHRIRGLAAAVLAVALFGVAGAATAQAEGRAVRYHGYVVDVPGSWPVYRLSANKRRCVRFDQHALYLGTPGSEQRCPAHLAGRTEAILIEPIAAGTRAASSGHAPSLAGRGTSFVVPAAGVVVTATWSGGQAVVERALHRRSLPVSGASPSRSPIRARATAAGRAHAAAAVYTGLGFDACSAPSQSQMSAWSSSPYRALGVYIGGVNSACAQPNLTATWVGTEIAAGWHLIPTYVGLQAPSNSCGCAAITPSQAAAQGTAAASDAVDDAMSIGLPAGNPIYDDMEGYSRTNVNTSAVLAFLSAWTSQLHADGYASGVYSSADSGIADLVSHSGTSYVEPDDIWIADWNGEQTTSDSAVPAGDWSGDQRLHQYRGAHNETYGGVTINIDNDYLDGATADTSTGSSAQAPPPLPSTPPALSLSPLPNGATQVNASWTGAFGVTAWRVLAGVTPTASALGAVAQAPAGGSVTKIAIRNAAHYFAVQALGSAGQVLGSSAPAALPPHIAVYGPTTFVPSSNGVGGIPVGCYTGSSCHITLAVKSGRIVIARTGTEVIGGGGAGILYYKLTARGRRLLAHAPRRRLSVQVSARDASGVTSTNTVNMIPFATSGRAPSRQITQSATARIIGATDFVSSGGVGGILAGCHNLIFCQISTTVKLGRAVVAQTGPEYLGSNELGDLIFRLTAHGRALLHKAAGNQLGATVTLTENPGTPTASTASAKLVLIRFS